MCLIQPKGNNWEVFIKYSLAISIQRGMGENGILWCGNCTQNCNKTAKERRFVWCVITRKKIRSCHICRLGCGVNGKYFYFLFHYHYASPLKAFLKKCEWLSARKNYIFSAGHFVWIRDFFPIMWMFVVLPSKQTHHVYICLLAYEWQNCI